MNRLRVYGFVRIAASLLLVGVACGGKQRPAASGTSRIVLAPPPDSVLRFDSVVIGEAPAHTVPIAVSNSGDGSLALERITIEGDDAQVFRVTSSPRTLAPGARGEISIGFDSQMRINAAAELRIESNDPELPIASYTLSGRAREKCSMRLTPPHVALRAGEMQRVTISAAGREQCTITHIFTDRTLFPLVSPPSLPSVIRPGGSLGLTVQHVLGPREIGVPIRELKIRESDGDEETVSLSGEAAVSGCLEVSPDWIIFPTAPAGRAARKKVKITNHCRQEAAVTSGIVTIGVRLYSLDMNTFPIRLPALGSADVWIDYVPSNRRGDDGSVTLNTSDAANPHLKITLLGYASLLDAEVFPTLVDFGRATYENPQGPTRRSSCGSPARYFQIYTNSEVDLFVSSLDIVGDPAFEIESVLVDDRPLPNFRAPFVIPPDKDAKVKLRFSPLRESPAQHDARLIISHNGECGPCRMVSLKAEAAGTAETVDTFHQLEGPKVDVLWVVADNPSMLIKQGPLNSGIDQFLDFADRQGADYQIAVVTTEGGSPESGQLRYCYPHPRILSSRYADPTTRLDALRCLLNVGVDGEGQVMGLQAAMNALIKATSPAIDWRGYNQGLIRPGARLAVVVVADREDQSSQVQKIMRDYFLSFGGPVRDQAHIHAIAGPVSAPCPMGPLFAEPGYDYYWMTQQTRGLFKSICESRWKSIISDLAQEIFSPLDAFRLSRPADPATLKVTVGGMQLSRGASNGFSYDAATNAVKLHGSAVPPKAAEISVSYSALCHP